ncbi:MAG TPA: carboxypeptidase regulatory-like domain-containing protein [Gemmataceae bacterium]|nr:carboxypeptidase regulatory-like domain-containing protein [Gemmataceae bacterium]
MRRSFMVAAAVIAPLLVSVVVIGCGRPVDDFADLKSGTGGAVAVGGGVAGGEKKPISGKPGALLKGRVTIQGDPDVVAKNQALSAQMQASQDRATCYDTAPASEKDEQPWLLGDNGGVGNVVVWLQPPDDGYFDVDLKNPTWPTKVELNQPHCAFIPHVTWIMPTVVDPDDPKKTIASGQEFLVSNNAPVSHNTKWDSNTSVSGGLGTLPAHTPPKDVPLTGNNAVYTFSCNIHSWMNAYVWVFNHPYAAVTDKNGNYVIKNVPVGTKLRITAWHEMGPYSHYLIPEKIKGKEITLNEGENSPPEASFTLQVSK